VPLTKGVAFVFKDARGQERLAGPTCGPKYVRPWREEHLDLARSVLSWTAEDESASGPSPATSADSRTLRDSQRRSAIIEASEYVVLRQRCLAEYAWARYDTGLGPMLQRIDAGTFDAGDAERVLKIIDWAAAKSPLLSLGNVRACYGYNRHMRRALRRLPAGGRAAEFIEGVLAYLRENGFLTAKQIERISECITKLGLAPLDPTSFAEVERFQRLRRQQRQVGSPGREQ
jgi:hypothetical protein